MNKLTQLIQGGRWAVTLGGFQALVAAAAEERPNAAELQSNAAESQAPVTYAVEQGVALIEVSGMLFQGAEDWMKEYYGFVDPLDLCAALQHADENPEVDSMLISWDSPGGIIYGIEEAADMLSMSSKPTLSHTGDLMCSAAYWIAAASDEIWSTQSAEVGSIGVYSSMTDYSRMFAEDGVERIRFRDGDLKGIGMVGVAVEPHEREHMQAGIDAEAARFRDQMRAYRPSISDAAMRGQTTSGWAASEVGLVDRVGTLAEAFEHLAAGAQPPPVLTNRP